MVALAEKIQRLPAFRDKLSPKFVEESIFSWLKSSFNNKQEKQSLIHSLVEAAGATVKPITIYVPLANTVVEHPFPFCGTVIRNISKTLVDEILSISESSSDQEKKDNTNTSSDKFRNDYQGYAAVELNLECEPDYANELAVITAQRVTSFLGIYSGALLIPDIKCTSRIKGTENLAQSTTISRTQPDGLSIKSSLIDIASSNIWHIASSDLENYVKCGLEIISKITTKEKPSEFEKLLLNSFILYSKAAFTAEPLEKLVYILSALESTLLKNENEPIQQNLAERLAVFTSHELAERKSIIRSVKSVYGLRSKYLHHGHSSSELEHLSNFFRSVWVFYIQLLGSYQTFTNKSEFLEAIDDQKLG